MRPMVGQERVSKCLRKVLLSFNLFRPVGNCIQLVEKGRKKERRKEHSFGIKGMKNKITLYVLTVRSD